MELPWNCHGAMELPWNLPLLRGGGMYISHSVTPRARVSRDQTAVVQTRQGVIPRSSRLGVRHGANTATVLKVACSRLQHSHEQRSWKLVKKKHMWKLGSCGERRWWKSLLFPTPLPPPPTRQITSVLFLPALFLWHPYNFWELGTG